MVRRRPAFALFVAALLFTCSALAQAPGQEASPPGFWRAGKWIGYTPAHLKYGNREPRVPVSPSRTSSTSDPRASIASTAGEAAPVAGRSRPSRKTASDGRGSVPVDGEVVPASFQQAMPAQFDGMVVDPGQSTCGVVGACDVPMSAPGMCCGAPWIWGRAEYLLWWTSGMSVPPLVTTSPDGTVWEEAGVLGQPDTEILFGDARLAVGAQSGGRFTLGMWFDPGKCRGLEATYMMLGEGTERFEQSSEGDPILARPFFNTATGEQDALVVAFDGNDVAGDPHVLHGSILVGAKTRLQGAEVIYRRSLFQQCESRLDFLLGYQFNRLEDELLIEQEFTVEDDPIVVAGTTVELFDLFDTRNDFHGAQLGLVFRERVGRWSTEMSMKLGLGNTHSQVVIDGSKITTTPGADPDPVAEGLLARETNIGVYEQDQFTMIPELGVTLGYDITCGLRATFGYTFVYWSKVARPGDQIDLNVFLPQPNDTREAEHPEFSWVTTDFWAQGLRFGLDYRF
jgi:hypothetical protein